MKHYVESGRPALRTTSLVEVRSVKVTRPKDEVIRQMAQAAPAKRPRTRRHGAERPRLVAERAARIDRAAAERSIIGPIGSAE